MALRPNEVLIDNVLSRISVWRKSSLVAGWGDSHTQGPGAGSFYNKWLYRSGGWMSKGNFGASGERSDQALARADAVIASGAKRVTVQIGTNDIGQSVTESVLRTNVIGMFDALRDAGLEPIDISLFPRSNGLPVRHAEHNYWRKLYCAKNAILHFDAWPLLANADGSYKSGVNLDPIHLNDYGASIVGDGLQAFLESGQFSSPFLAHVDLLASSARILPNAVSFTDSNADGVPDNWTAVGTGGTYSIQNADSGDFGKWLRCSMTAATDVGFGTAGGAISGLAWSGGTGWSVGDRIALGLRVRWVDANQALSVRVQITGMSNAAPIYDEKGGTSTGEDMTIYYEFTIAPGTTSLGFRVTGRGTGYVEINRPVILNLTKEGLA